MMGESRLTTAEGAKEKAVEAIAARRKAEAAHAELLDAQSKALQARDAAVHAKAEAVDDPQNATKRNEAIRKINDFNSAKKSVVEAETKAKAAIEDFATKRKTVAHTHPWDIYHTKSGTPPGLRNPGSQVEEKNCGPTAIWAVKKNGTYEEVHDATAPFRRAKQPLLGGIMPDKFKDALAAAQLKPRPINDIVGTGTNAEDVADRLGDYLRNNPDKKVLAAVGPHVVVITGSRTDPHTNETFLQIWDPARGDQLAVPAAKVNWDRDNSYVVQP